MISRSLDSQLPSMHSQNIWTHNYGWSCSGNFSNLEKLPALDIIRSYCKFNYFAKKFLLQFPNRLISPLFQKSQGKSPTQGGRSPPYFFCTRSYAELRKSHSHSLHICSILAALIAAAASFCRPADMDSPRRCRRQFLPPVTAATDIRCRLLPS
jgi:hypothetical protein